MTVSTKTFHVCMQILAYFWGLKSHNSVIAEWNVTDVGSLMANYLATFWCKEIEDRSKTIGILQLFVWNCVKYANMEVVRRDSHIIILPVSELLNCVLAQLRKCNWAHIAQSGMKFNLAGRHFNRCCISLSKLVRVNSPNFQLAIQYTHT